MRPFEVPEEKRAAYHAAAAMASNLLIALEESAAEVLARIGIEDPRELLAPLVLRTAANWAERGPDALTGPIARGDAPPCSAIASPSPRARPSSSASTTRSRCVRRRWPAESVHGVSS